MRYVINQSHFYRPLSEGDNVLGSVHLSVRPSVCMSELSCLYLVASVRLSVNERNNPHYQSKMFVCVITDNQWEYADNRADAVDRLLIFSV